ncbi:unnamed protein product [Rangifer tarandus platyrhynchus]|uniref:Uncharacterized protein n=2 Tax=Rangifer tarandus platyrhynchus TaxID=3082113 RepID=A0ACB0EN10_RANTA|nr:unnamed protein product [Rangifer tarandus platyrhynchus]CAI9701884.1 unnamed protein product [Rangifer tarandus platyrhynchus]
MCTRRKEASYNHWLTPAALVSPSLDNEGQELFVTFSSLPPVVLDDRLFSDSSMIISEPAGGVTALTGSAGATVAALGDSELSRLCLYPLSSSQLTNQSAHADDVLPGTRAHAAAGGDVLVVWTANPERFCKVLLGLSDTAESLLHAVQLGLEVLPSTLSTMASILKGCACLGGYPRTTPGALELTWQRRVFVGADDYQSGQTKVRFVLVDFLIVSGLKTLSIVSYSHLATMTGRTGQRQHSSAPRKCPRAARYTRWWCTATQRSTCRARSRVTAWSSSTCYTWATASVSWMSTQQSGCWVVPTGWNCTTRSRTLSWPAPHAGPGAAAKPCRHVIFCTDVNPELQSFQLVLSLLGLASSCKHSLGDGAARWPTHSSASTSCIESTLRVCMGLPLQKHALLEREMKRPVLKRVGLVATACPVPCKKGAAPTSPSGFTGDTNGHSQAEAPQMPTA